MSDRSSVTFDSGRAMTVCGVPGRLTHRIRKPGQAPEHPRPTAAAMAWCDYLDGVLEHAGDMSGQEIADTLEEEIDKIERRGLISANDAAALRVVYSAAD